MTSFFDKFTWLYKNIALSKNNTKDQTTLVDNIDSEEKNPNSTDLKLDISYAVLLIDMQEHFLEGIGDIQDQANLINSQIDVIRYCKKFGIPLIRIEYKDCGPTEKILKDETTNLPKKYKILKTTDDAFQETKLQELLLKLNVKNLFLMGLYMDCCVQETAKSALRLGYEISTASTVTASEFGENAKILATKWYKKNGKCADHHLDLVQMCIQ